VGYVQETLISIAADGVISQDETSEFNKVIHILDSISKNAQEIKLWAQKKAGKEV
jgi:nucleoside diphosphate kinase